ncbi:hypothetical protein [Ruminococcus flavefaciens]|uniref:hypothetical protein n=1 Tax=Ruminococcus flavefaciens TaxID=1265 RepID=UPI000310D973|nr:hypothetical protein [Ruminococcus flavefaciens]
MFFSPIKTEPIPERVFSISHIVADKSPLDEKELEGILIPVELNNAKTSYFRPVFDTALELGLIGYNDDHKVIFMGDKKDIKSLKDFRKFCNSKVFYDSTTDFFKMISCFLSSNDEWLKYGSVTTSNEIIRIINKETDIASLKLEKDVILGVRFWINFLGFGYFQESDKIFLPNMYTALKDFMALGNLKTGMEYSVEDFLNNLHNGSTVAMKNVKATQTLNLAMSNALRLMHDNKEIELKIHLDSEKIWHLFPNEEHEFTSDITHIVIKKAVK